MRPGIQATAAARAGCTAKTIAPQGRDRRRQREAQEQREEERARDRVQREVRQVVPEGARAAPLRVETVRDRHQRPVVRVRGIDDVHVRPPEGASEVRRSGQEGLVVDDEVAVVEIREGEPGAPYVRQDGRERDRRRESPAAHRLLKRMSCG